MNIFIINAINGARRIGQQVHLQINPIITEIETKSKFLFWSGREAKPVFVRLLNVKVYCSGITFNRMMGRVHHISTVNCVDILVFVVWIGDVASDMIGQRVTVLVKETDSLPFLVRDSCRILLGKFDINVRMFHA